MGRPLVTTIFWCASILLAGCNVSPWSPRGPAETKTGPKAPTPAVAASSSGDAPGGAGDAQAMQQVIAELQQVGALDPGAQEKLMADLRQTDPGLWPLVLQQFRAAAAYRRRAEHPETVADEATRGHDPTLETDRSTRPLGQEPAAAVSESTTRSGRAEGPAGPLGGVAPPDVTIQDTGGASGTHTAGTGQASGTRAAGTGQASGTHTSGTHAKATGGAGGTLPQTAASTPSVLPSPQEVRQIPKPKEPPPASQGEKGQVVPTSYESPAAADWQTHLAAAIRAMEVETKGETKTDAQIAQQARLRMLYLLAGRREDALQPIPSAPSAAQDFWSKQIFGLSTWLDAERTPDSARRAAETKRILDEAMARLGETAPLTVRNLAFCTSVQSYGAIQPFKKNEFAPDQEVLLYAEVDNFVAESSAKGFHTSLKSCYQILDSRGQRVADHEFAAIEEFCQNPRRDFFVGYRLRLPKRIYPGKHTLQLTVEDLKSHKVGQSSIEFTTKGEE